MSGPVLVLGVLTLSLAPGTARAATQSLEDRSEFLSGSAVYTAAQAATECVTPLVLEGSARIREPRCVVLDVKPITEAAPEWHVARYRRSAIAEWREAADTAEWDEVVLLRAVDGGSSLVPAWHIRTERTLEFLSGVTARSRPEGLLIEILTCLNGTGGCSRGYLLDSAAGLQHVSMPFIDDLRATLGDGRRLHKGVTLDLETLRGTWPVATLDDANCCPSYEFDYAVRLDGTRLVLVDAELRAASGHEPIADQQTIGDGALVARIDSLAEELLADGLIAGISIGVQRGGQLLIAQGYGFADLENPAPAGAQTIYGIGSVTKQFTAAAIMRLVEAGTLALDDPITRFLPDYGTQGHHVTIRHLLTHTSGIRDHTRMEAWEETTRLDLSDEEMLAFFEDEPFDFAPGERFLYDNSGYVLLDMIIAAASGESYADHVETHLFEPLGLSRTSYCDTRGIVRGRARGYWIEEGELVNAEYLSMTHPRGAGALCSTVLDLLSWSSALRDGRVVSQDGYQQMVTRAVLNDGQEVDYGFGLRITTRLEGILSISHSGGVNGYHAALDHYPDADLDIAVLTNTNGLHARRFSDTVAKWVLGIPVPVAIDEPRSPEELEQYVGVYADADREWTIVRSDGRLFLRIPGAEDSRLRAQGGRTFVPRDNDYTRITFHLDGDRAGSLTVDQCVPLERERCRTLTLSRVRR